MRRTLFAALLFALPVAAFAASSNPQRMIVLTRDAADRMAKAGDLDFVFDGRHEVRTFHVINGFAANLTQDEIARLKRSPNVLDIEEDVEVHAFELDRTDGPAKASLVPHALADSLTPGGQTTAYGVTMVNAPAVWPYTKGKSLDASKPIRVAIIDTGIDYNDAELKTAYKGGFNFIDNSDDPFDDAGHGSHVAGIIAAADNGLGVVGVAPEVELYSLKVLNDCGSGSTSNIIAAIDWVIAKKASIGGNWICNLSLGSSKGSTAEQLVMQRAADANVMVFAASGNAFNSTTTQGLAFPAAYTTTVSVGAIASDGTVASFSQRGTALKVVAPGVSVLSTYVDGAIRFPDATTSVARYANAFDDAGNEICIGHDTMSGPFVFVKTGLPTDYPADMTGKIALIERGGIDPAVDKTVDPNQGFTFLAKSKYAKNAGAAGAVVYSIPGRVFVQPGFTFTTGEGEAASVVPLALISEADGAKLKAMTGAITVAYTNKLASSTFDLLDGTSMATPHATAVAALVWASTPSAKATDVENAMEQAAKDLGDKGRDVTFGFGLVSAFDAGKMLNPALFGAPPPSTGLPTSPVPSGRRATKRGK